MSSSKEHKRICWFSTWWLSYKKKGLWENLRSYIEYKHNYLILMNMSKYYAVKLILKTESISNRATPYVSDGKKEILMNSFFNAQFNYYPHIWMLHNHKNRSSFWRCSIEKGVLRNFAKFTGKHLFQSLLFNKRALLKKRLWHRCFPVTFAKFLRTSFL